MITNQILKTLLDNAALSEKDGLTFKEIQSCLTENFTVKVLQSMRVDGLINNAMQKNLNVWWLTAKGADMALVDVETMQPISEPEPQCPASVGGDIDPDADGCLVPPAPDYAPESVKFADAVPVVVTHCKTTQMAANLEDANTRIGELIRQNTELEYEIMTLTDQINLLTSNLEVESTYRELKEPVGYLLGDSIGKNLERPLQLYSENDALMAIGSLEKAKTIGEQSCLESAYDFGVYALVPVGYFKSRQVVDFVAA